MNNSIFPMAAFCAGVMLFTINCFATPTPQATQNSYGLIHLFDDKGVEKCTLAVPETSKIFDFSSNSEYCENDSISSFWLENVPSATLIQFYDNAWCNDAQTPRVFYFKLKTTKNPTDWNESKTTIDGLRNINVGGLISKKNTRMEEKFIGSEYANKNLNERISCVYIERSQPVN